MLDRFARGAPALLDLACGRGGDIWKWIDAGVLHVKGIDLSPHEILEAQTRCACDGCWGKGPGKREERAPRVSHCLALQPAQPRSCGGRSGGQGTAAARLRGSKGSTHPGQKAGPRTLGPADDRTRRGGAATVRPCWHALRRRYKEAREKRPDLALDYVFEATPELGLSEWKEARTYDVVTCMFAAHYFFVSEAALKQVCMCGWMGGWGKRGGGMWRVGCWCCAVGALGPCQVPVLSRGCWPAAVPST